MSISTPSPQPPDPSHPSLPPSRNPQSHHDPQTATDSGARRSRILFLDDDPIRAALFKTSRSEDEVIWVQTVPECLEQLETSWDEVHLDHDLGGEKYVDPRREDCGMAVVRWLTARHRSHLDPTHFVIHTHNTDAGETMVGCLRAMGYRAVARPFRDPLFDEDRVNGFDPPAESEGPPGSSWWLVKILRSWLWGRSPASAELNRPTSPSSDTTPPHHR